jgi:hypothetical protein
MSVGDIVVVLPPFDYFDGWYIIEDINSDGAVFLVGIDSGFDPMYLEKV